MTNEYSAAQERYESISSQHGGYWRHGFIDHNYLYNLYFPPEDFFTDITRQIHQLVLNYPIAQKDIACLVGGLIGQPPERIVVGNGAAELIKIIAGMGRKLIVPVPSFNEYANASPAGNVVEFPLESPSFQLGVDKFAAEAVRCKAGLAVVVTPNNPTSLLVPKAQLIRLLKKLAVHDCMLIVDESFIDFARNRDQETLEKEIDAYPNLAIFKSMSKAYGICGLRIGYMLTANSDFAANVRQGLHIWNINGFAEEFLRLAPQYRQEFTDSCSRVKDDRDHFYEQLQTVQGMIVYQPDANYIFCRLPDHAASGPEVTEKLFVKHNIYIKHCQDKTMPESDRYIRIASRTQPENLRLVEALRDIVVLE
jgi:histidinol-phosphate/aromatic aminotransferase/cobyric acid decarboxylase-like protein